MPKPMIWAERLHIGQLIMLSLLLLLGAAGGALWLLSASEDHASCTEAASFRDSLGVSIARLRSSDSVLLHFDLAEADDPLNALVHSKTTAQRADTARRSLRILHNLIAMRAQGADGVDLRKYLVHDEHLHEGPAGLTRDSAARQLAAIHDYESDTLYVRYVIETTEGNTDKFSLLWHDTTWLKQGLANWSRRCGNSDITSPLAFITLFVPLIVLCATWWIWFGARRASV